MKKIILITGLLLQAGQTVSSNNLDFNQIFTKPCFENVNTNETICLKIVNNQEKTLGHILFSQLQPTFVDKIFQKKVDPTTTHVAIVMIEDAYQKKGLGTLLLQKAEDYFPCKTLTLRSEPDALGFYEKLGFECTKNFTCTKPCTQNLFPKPAQTSRLESQITKA